MRKPIAMNVSIKRTVALVYALCKLHNYCIHRKEVLTQTLSNDRQNIGGSGGIYLPRLDGERDHWEYDMAERSRDRINDLLDGGNHREDVTDSMRRAHQRNDTTLPNASMLSMVEERGYKRPRSSIARNRNISSTN